MVQIDDLCTFDNKGKKQFDFKKAKLLLEDDNFSAIQRPHTIRFIELVCEGRKNFKDHKDKFDKRKRKVKQLTVRNVERKIRCDKGRKELTFEWHHLIFSSFSGSDNVPANVLPFEVSSHIEIHCVMMMFIKNWQVSIAAEMLLNTRKKEDGTRFYAEDVIDSASIPYATEIAQHGRVECASSRSTKRRTKRKSNGSSRFGSHTDSNKVNEISGKLPKQNQFEIFNIYTQAQVEQGFEESNGTERDGWLDWEATDENAVWLYKGRKFKKVGANELRVKRHLLRDFKTEKTCVEKAVKFVGNDFSFRNNFDVTENGDIMVRNSEGNCTKKLVKLNNRELRKMCSVLPGVTFPDGSRKLKEMIEKIKEQFYLFVECTK